MHEEMMKEADFLLGLNKKEIMREMRKRKGEDVKDWDENRPREAGEDEDTEIVEAPPRIVTRDMMEGLIIQVGRLPPRTTRRQKGLLKVKFYKNSLL